MVQPTNDRCVFMRATYFVHRPRTPRTRFCCCFFFLAFLQRLLNERVHLRLCVHVSGDFFFISLIMALYSFIITKPTTKKCAPLGTNWIQMATDAEKEQYCKQYINSWWWAQVIKIHLAENLNRMWMCCARLDSVWPELFFDSEKMNDKPRD